MKYLCVVVFVYMHTQCQHKELEIEEWTRSSSRESFEETLNLKDTKSFIMANVLCSILVVFTYISMLLTGYVDDFFLSLFGLLLSDFTGELVDVCLLYNNSSSD